MRSMVLALVILVFRLGLEVYLESTVICQLCMHPSHVCPMGRHAPAGPRPMLALRLARVRVRVRARARLRAEASHGGRICR